MKFFFGLFLLYLKFITYNCEIAFHLTKIECVSDTNTKYLENIVCEIRSLKRGVKVFSLSVDIVLPIKYALVSYEFAGKSSSNVYSIAMIDLKEEWCKVMDDTAKSPFMGFFLPTIKAFMPNHIHKCPYGPEKAFGLSNVTFDIENFPMINLSIFPRGDYRVSFNVSDKAGDLIFWLRTYITVGVKRYQKKTKKDE